MNRILIKQYKEDKHQNREEIEKMEYIKAQLYHQRDLKNEELDRIEEIISKCIKRNNMEGIELIGLGYELNTFLKQLRRREKLHILESERLKDICGTLFANSKKIDIGLYIELSNILEVI